ncbi:MAG: hypothetical protein JRM80_05325 [Nitrososphaerota archaeon]|nr:hypothetical protein [Nitrososphaerota archaeon]
MDADSLPFEYKGQRVWVRAKIGPQDAFGTLDTGADGTAIDAGLAPKVGLVARGSEAGIVEEGELRLETSGPARFDLGAVKLEVEKVYILPLALRVANLDFILGVDALAQTPFTLDYPTTRIELRLGSGRSVPFASMEDIRPTLRLEILGEEFTGTVDTGSGGGLSLPLRWVEKNASRLGVHLGRGSERTILGQGRLQFHDFRIGRVAIEGVEMEGVPTEGVTSEKGSASDQSSNWASVGKVLERIGRIGVDCRRRLVVLGR